QPPLQCREVHPRGRPRGGARGARGPHRGGLGGGYRHRHRDRGPGGHLRGVPPGRHRLRAQARGDGPGAGAGAALRGAARGPDLGEERGGAGIDVHLHPSGAPMAGELILIVEDNEKNRKLERDLLLYHGYRVLEAITAEEGRRRAQETPPALILMDIQLPGISGIEALTRLRAEPATRAIPVMAVTASAMTHDRQKILDAGFDGYQSKPISVKEFVGAVRRSLDARMGGGRSG